MVDLEVAEVEGSREAMGVVEEERVEVSREPETGSVQTRESEFGVSTHHLLNEDRKTFLLLLYKIMVLKVLSFFSFMVSNDISLVIKWLYICKIVSYFIVRLLKNGVSTFFCVADGDRSQANL